VTDKLIGLHPRLIAAVTRITDAMAALGFHMIVTDGWRTVEQQAALYAKGRTAPGKIVTNADGELKRSNHQAHADGFGHAADMTFLDGHGQPTWADDLPWRLYGEMAKSQGLVWGGEWKSITDRPHIELPESAR
jgi:peptidoglycan L-alanyl-D-glutamate endopeptidase CwlK